MTAHLFATDRERSTDDDRCRRRACTDLDAAASARAFVEEFLRDALGYADTRATAPRNVGERSFPLSLQATPHIPVVVAPATLDLDEPDPAFAPQGGGARKKSPFQLLQEYLNAEPEARWGLASNGRKLRLARDAATLTRPSFIEFDLETMLGQARYPDFAALWRLLHASRATRTPEPVWELWRADGQREGARVREGLRIGVESALVTLGEGFLKHPANEPLRRALIAGELKRQAFFEELLRLVYRFIFVCGEEIGDITAWLTARLGSQCPVTSSTRAGDRVRRIPPCDAYRHRRASSTIAHSGRASTR